MWLDLGEYHGPSHFHAFVMYALARRRAKSVRMTCWTYVAESLRCIPQNQYIPHGLDYYLKPRDEIDAQAIIDKVVAAVGGEE